MGTEPAPSGPFDLIHARLVLVHVPDRDRAIASMVDALRPGGWLLLEEADPGLQELACPDEWGPDQRLANRLKREFRTLLAQRGVDLAFGRTLPRRLRSAGLVEVESDAYFPMGGPFCDELERATVEQIRELLVEAAWPKSPISTGIWPTWPPVGSIWPPRRWSRRGVASPSEVQCAGCRRGRGARKTLVVVGPRARGVNWQDDDVRVCDGHPRRHRGGRCRHHPDL